MDSNIKILIESLETVKDTTLALRSASSIFNDRTSLLPITEKVNDVLEKSVILSRNTLEYLQADSDTSKAGAPVLPYIHVSGEVRILEYDWLHIKLNTLLPHCRFQTPIYIGDTITRLLNAFSAKGGKISYFKNAFLIIDEHCDIANRTVFDQDNKGWKAVSNVLKGRVFPDDDQFSLGIALISTKSPIPTCNIFVIPASDAGDFFAMQTQGVLYW